MQTDRSDAELSDVQDITLTNAEGRVVDRGIGLRSLIVLPSSDTVKRTLLVLLLSLLVGVLAYQAPPSGGIAVGWLGDQLVLDSSPGLGAEATERGDFYADDLTPDSPTGRSRWTRQHARIVLPNIGTGTDMEVTLLAQGWPEDVIGATVEQPSVTIHADGSEIGTFIPAEHWDTYTFPITSRIRTGADLTLDIHASDTFTDTQLYGPDPRPKGVRLAGVYVQTRNADPIAILPPAWGAVGALTLTILLLYGLLAQVLRSASLVFVLTILGAGLAGIGLALLRIWMGAALGATIWVLVVAIILSWQQQWLYLLRVCVQRYAHGHMLSYGLVIAALAWLGYVLARFSLTYRPPGFHIVRDTFPDSLLYGLLGAGLLALTLVLGRKGLPRVAHGIVGLLGSQRGALIMLLLLGGIWLAYEALVVFKLPYVGHADYADNAVVARNLVAGRGWVVDYVTQFYQLYDGVTRPQETWPLLQPVWIAPFLAIFGPQAWAAKIPNLIFNLILLLLIYRIGTQLWDRRVGVTAAILTLTNHLFFKLTIYTTSDLAFVVFALGAIYLLYRATGDRRPPTADIYGRSMGRLGLRRFVPGTSLPSAGSDMNASPCCAPAGWSMILRRSSVVQRPWLLVGSGVLTGLMMLQKPSGAMIAVGMGLWLLAHIRRPSHDHVVYWSSVVRQWAVVGLVWAVPALLILSPYVVRNLALFGAPVYSTERYDAWVLGYRGDSGIAWEDIYRIYTPKLDGPGLPDRSWILRWGFDYTLAKFNTQVRFLRDYLMPAWTGVPASLHTLLSADEDKNIAAPLGAWLSFLGVIAALRTRRRLLSLLGSAFAPYMLFMLIYWRTNEERYWVMLIPWLALLAAWMIWAGFDRLAAIGDGRWSPLGLILVVVTLVTILQPSWPKIAEKVEVEPARWAPDLAAYAWLRNNTAPDTVIMTRIPWQLNWHTERPAVMIPNTAERDMLLYLAHYYDAEYLVLETQLRVKGDVLPIMAPLMNAQNIQIGDTIDDFTLVYASPTPDNRVMIYRFPEGIGNKGHGTEDGG